MSATCAGCESREACGRVGWTLDPAERYRCVPAVPEPGANVCRYCWRPIPDSVTIPGGRENGKWTRARSARTTPLLYCTPECKALDRRAATGLSAKTAARVLAVATLDRTSSPHANCV